MNQQRARELYRLMRTAREIDEQETLLVAQNMAHFCVAGVGHEVTATLAAHLTPADWLHLHYRDKALLLARGMPIVEFFRVFLCRADARSAGRQMTGFYASSPLHILGMNIPVANNTLQAVGVAAAVKDQPERPIVVCSTGDGSTQEGEFLEAVGEAARSRLPMLFIVENNGYAISTATRGKTFFDQYGRRPKEFFGIAIHHVDGTDAVATDEVYARLVPQVRETRAPVIVVLHVERLCSHSNADDQSKYRPLSELAEALRVRDPIRRLEQSGLLGSDAETIAQQVRDEVAATLELALHGHTPSPQYDAKAPLPQAYLERKEFLGVAGGADFTMRQALNAVLQQRLQTDPRVFLYGEDIEDPKGDVFGVTSGLSTEFPGRVVNAPLSEATIVGSCIGRAVTGQRPVGFIQFADFMPPAYNQIVTELGSLYWRTNGDWHCPVILMITCGAYKPGLGPFHSQTFESVMVHTPGLDVVMPSSAADAAGLLNAAFESGRPTVFLYPKSCLNLSDRATSKDVSNQFVPLGKARRLRSGRDLTLVTWGSPIAQCTLAAEALETVGATVDLFDLRSLSPWDEAAIVASAERTGRLVVVHEDNISCGFGAEVVSRVAELTTRKIACRRVARPDTYLPFNFENQLAILPSFKSILETCADLLGYDVAWQKDAEEASGVSVIEAIGSGPADDSVEVIEMRVKAGDAIELGQVVAVVEATKSVVDVASTCAGRVIEVCAQPGDSVLIGKPLFRVEVAEAKVIRKPLVKEQSGTPQLTKRAVDVAKSPSTRAATVDQPATSADSPYIYISRPMCVSGSSVQTTEALVARFPAWTAPMAFKRSGVATRNWIGEGETCVSLATQAANKLLESLGSNVPRIAAVMCSATFPQQATPSIACQVAGSLAVHNCFADNFCAFDFNAACSGFLYGLRLAHDHLRTNEPLAVLLLTSEVVSPVLDPSDPTTTFLLGDAATATLVTRQPSAQCELQVRRPMLLSPPDVDLVTCSPCSGAGFLKIDGITMAVHGAAGESEVLQRALAEAGITINDLVALLPQPGSRGILQGLGKALGMPDSRIWHTLEETGNTASSAIPLALNRFWPTIPRDQQFGMVAFGAGFTSAATTAQLLGSVG